MVGCLQSPLLQPISPRRMSLLLVCPPPQLREPWTAWLIDERARLDGVRPSDAQRFEGPPSAWPAAQEWVLVVPADLLAWHQTTLPRLPPQRWRQALPGLLEEQLLSDPDQLHMALAPGAQSAAPTLVAVLNKAWLKEVMATLEALGRRVQRIVPEFEPGPPTLYLLGQPDHARLVQTDAQGVLVMPLAQPVRDGLGHWMKAMGPLPDTAWAEPPLVEQAQLALNQNVQLLPIAQRLWQAAQSDWDLAQFEWAASGTQRWRQRAWRTFGQLWQAPGWRPLRWGLLSLLVVNLLGLQLWSWQEQERLQSQKASIEAVLRSSFPQVKVIIDPLAQMQREVQSLALVSGSPDAGDLGVMLSALAESGAPPARRVNYSPGQLQLSDWPLTAQQLTALQASLTLRGYALQGAGQQWQLTVKSP
jgi:general secretion pathway protein L